MIHDNIRKVWFKVTYRHCHLLSLKCLSTVPELSVIFPYGLLLMLEEHFVKIRIANQYNKKYTAWPHMFFYDSCAIFKSFGTWPATHLCLALSCLEALGTTPQPHPLLPQPHHHLPPALVCWGKEPMMALLSSFALWTPPVSKLNLWTPKRFKTAQGM